MEDDLAAALALSMEPNDRPNQDQATAQETETRFEVTHFAAPVQAKQQVSPAAAVATLQANTAALAEAGSVAVLSTLLKNLALRL